MTCLVIWMEEEVFFDIFQKIDPDEAEQCDYRAGMLRTQRRVQGAFLPPASLIVSYVNYAQMWEELPEMIGQATGVSPKEATLSGEEANKIMKDILSEREQELRQAYGTLIASVLDSLEHQEDPERPTSSPRWQYPRDLYQL